MAFPALCAGGQSGAANPVKQPVSAGNELYFLRVGDCPKTRVVKKP